MTGKRDNKSIRVHITTMGCPKNLVDSEAAAAVLYRAGCELTNEPSDADVLLVGACSFLTSAWSESPAWRTRSGETPRSARARSKISGAGL